MLPPAALHLFPAAVFAPGDRVCLIPACIVPESDGDGLNGAAVLTVVAVHPNRKWYRYTVRSESDGSELTVHEAELVSVAH